MERNLNEIDDEEESKENTALLKDLPNNKDPQNSVEPI